MFALFLQAWIFAAGALSIWLLSDPLARRHQPACWVGLSAQPFWLWSTFQNHQWGMLALTVFYSVCFIRGIAGHHRRLPSFEEIMK